MRKSEGITWAASIAVFLAIGLTGPTIHAQDESRIVGGVPSSAARRPYSVSLMDRGGHFCGGSLIQADRVLTAQHCTLT